MDSCGQHTPVRLYEGTAHPMTICGSCGKDLGENTFVVVPRRLFSFLLDELDHVRCGERLCPICELIAEGREILEERA